MLAADLVKEKGAGKKDSARDDPIDVVPKHSRLVEKRSEGCEIQQPNSIETAEQGEVNQRQVACPAAEEEKNDCGKGDRQDSDGGRNFSELPAQLGARERNHEWSRKKRGYVRHVQLYCSQFTIHRNSGLRTADDVVIYEN